ncbi:TIGR02530 family flagellar biosynthesis protein [Candidatus Kapaibacterium sp.]
MLDINGVAVPFLPIEPISDGRFINRPESKQKSYETPFSEIFAEELGKLKFSGHAISRMASREINLSNNELNRLENAIQKLEVKSSKESLVMLDEKAFIVNVPNKTVITMFTRDNMEESIVTKIDSAVFA